MLLVVLAGLKEPCSWMRIGSWAAPGISVTLCEGRVAAGSTIFGLSCSHGLSLSYCVRTAVRWLVANQVQLIWTICTCQYAGRERFAPCQYENAIEKSQCTLVILKSVHTSIFQRGIPLHSNFSTQVLARTRAVTLCHQESVRGLILFGQFVPGGRQTLAMASPGCKEFDHDHPLTRQLTKVLLCQ